MSGEHAGAVSRTPHDSYGVNDYDFRRRVGVAMFLLGAITLLATLPLPDPDASDHSAIKIIAGLLAIGALVAWTVRTYRPRVVSAYVIYGILLVSALMAVTRPIEATPFFYLWPMLFAAYFFSRREVAIDLVIMWVTLGLALFVWSIDPMKQVLFMGVGVSVTLTPDNPACVNVTSPLLIATGLTSVASTLSYGGTAPLPCSTVVKRQIAR